MRNCAGTPAQLLPLGCAPLASFACDDMIAPSSRERIDLSTRSKAWHVHLRAASGRRVSQNAVLVPCLHSTICAPRALTLRRYVVDAAHSQIHLLSAGTGTGFLGIATAVLGKLNFTRSNEHLVRVALCALLWWPAFRTN